MKPFFDYLLGKIRVKDTDSGGSGSGDMTKAVYDPAGINEQLLGIPITVDFLTLAQLGADSEVIEGQVYKYVDAGFLPASIDHILLTGSGTQTYNNIGQAYVTAIGKYVQCDYDLASNTIICILEQEFLIIDDGVTFSVTPLKDDFVGITYTLSFAGGSDDDVPYRINASSDIWNTNNTKIIGLGSTDSSNELLLSYGLVESLNKIMVNLWNIFGQYDNPKNKTRGSIIKVITTL